MVSQSYFFCWGGVRRYFGLPTTPSPNLSGLLYVFVQALQGPYKDSLIGFFLGSD